LNLIDTLTTLANRSAPPHRLLLLLLQARLFCPMSMKAILFAESNARLDSHEGQVSVGVMDLNLLEESYQQSFWYFY
jgi:hypothetical protein